jgi:hypothetical protein
MPGSRVVGLAFPHESLEGIGKQNADRGVANLDGELPAAGRAACATGHWMRPHKSAAELRSACAERPNV